MEKFPSYSHSFSSSDMLTSRILFDGANFFFMTIGELKEYWRSKGMDVEDKECNPVVPSPKKARATEEERKALKKQEELHRAEKQRNRAIRVAESERIKAEKRITILVEREKRKEGINQRKAEKELRRLRREAKRNLTKIVCQN